MVSLTLELVFEFRVTSLSRLYNNKKEIKL